MMIYICAHVVECTVQYRFYNSYASCYQCSLAYVCVPIAEFLYIEMIFDKWRSLVVVIRVFL